MKVVSPVTGTGLQAPVGAAGTPQVGASAFQARLNATGGAPASSVGAASPSGSEIVQNSFQEMRSLLRLQYQLSMGRDSLISNVMKTRHETAKNAISNIR